MRGLALVLVVVFHLFGAGRVSGGVDVFLVVSGFLATRSLLSRARRDDLSLAAYYGNVFSRLVPPALIVLVATAGIAVAFMHSGTWATSAREIAAAAGYWVNWEMIGGQLAYGAAGPQTSLVQHFWSMSVQGQFFFVWPLVVFGVIAAGRRRPRVLPPVSRVSLVALTALTAAATVASFVYAAQLHLVDQPRAYFDSFARFWELGAGALLALSWPHLSVPGWLRAPLAWAGLLMVVACGFVLDGATVFPGPWTLWPVAATFAVLLGAGPASGWGPRRLLEGRPLTLLADLSYAIYLWHWPLLMAWTYLRRSSDPGEKGALLILVVSVLLAWLTDRFVSGPVQRLGTRTGARVMLGATVTCALVFSGGLTASSLAMDAHSRTLVEQAAAVEKQATCLGAAAMDPKLAPCEDPSLEGLRLPPLTGLRQDDDNTCGWATGDQHLKWCTVGPKKGYGRHLLAVGDSHNNTLLGAYRKIAKNRNWRIDVAGRAGCFWSTRAPKKANPADAQGCVRWIKELSAGIKKRAGAGSGIDAIIVTHSAKAKVLPRAGETPEEALVKGKVEAWAKRPDRTVPVIAIRDNPIFDANGAAYARDVITCIERAGDDAATACALPRERVLLTDSHVPAVQRDPNAHLIDLSYLYCGQDVCAPVIGHAVVYRDGRHLTGTFARSLTPYLGHEFDRIMRENPRPQRKAPGPAPSASPGADAAATK
ncbi:acyltransferase family protein [Myceligenerans crystallogenes]|uniref:Acyltransferase family protein n=1 Tax=Myceligenerans crystallogenes TaxID=316335 RepID=A0ABP4ZJS4_9MICO